MGWLRRIVARIASTFDREQLAADVRDELECHLSLLTEQNLTRGLSLAEARSQALGTLGNPEAVREEYFRAAGFPILDQLLGDAGRALRGWGRDRALSATLVLLLTLGISVAAFALALAPRLRALSSYGSAPRDLLAVVHYSDRALGDWNRFDISIWDSAQEYLAWKSRAGSFAELTVEQPGVVVLEASGKSQRLRGTRVDNNFFHALRMQPSLGERSLSDFWNDQEGVVLSDSVWKTVFASDPQVVGRTVRVDGRELHVSGVMPPDVFPTGDLWLPFQLNTNKAWMKSHQALVLARLRAGVSRRDAEAELANLAQIESGPNEDLPADTTTELIPAQRLVDAIDEESIRLLMWLGGAILLAAWVNSATLLLQRTIRRAREFSVRGALGAAQNRLSGEMVMEGLLLSLVAAMAAVAAAAAADCFLRSSFPQQLSALPWLSIFWRQSMYIVLLAPVSAGLCALPSVLKARSCVPLGVARARGQSATAGEYRDLGRSVLVGCQIAFALTTLIGAGEMFRTFSWQWMKFRIRQAPENVLALELGIKQQGVNSAEQLAAVYQNVLAKAAAIPGIDSAAITSQPPFHGEMVATGRPMMVAGNRSARIFVQFVSPGFFRQFSIPLIRGRLLEENDGPKTRVAVISQQMAKAYFGNTDPVGQQVCRKDNSGCMAIVGIVGDFQNSYYSSGVEATLYRPLSDAAPQLAMRSILLLRTRGDAQQYAASTASALSGLDARLHLGPAESLSRSYKSSTSQYGTLTLLFAMFSASAILLAVLGVYGLILQWTASRMREIAIRVALGATERNIFEITTRKIASLLIVATLAGLPLAAAAVSSLSRILSIPVDRSVFMSSAAAVACAVLLGSYLPARNASRVDPVTILRSE